MTIREIEHRCRLAEEPFIHQLVWLEQFATLTVVPGEGVRRSYPPSAEEARKSIESCIELIWAEGKKELERIGVR